MKTKIIFFLVIVFGYLYFFGWGGVSYSGSLMIYDTRIAKIPFIVWEIVVPTFSWGSVGKEYTYLKYQCLMLPFEKYTVSGGAYSGDGTISGMAGVDSGRCHGVAKVYAENYNNRFIPIWQR